ncbi:MAG: hypothetical protein A2Y55_04635 [Actinobacteria bacterium RBG_16_68_12]|nr:MAG: hypothetical protein A2Y55_04635 [Actinobacteria bacterium RBG_16_68_12]
MGRHLPKTLSIGALLAVAILASSSAADKPGTRAAETRSAAATLAGRVTIVTSLESSLRGTFTIRGAISDSGSVQARRAVAASRVRLTETLKGKKGTIRLLATQICGSGGSTWRVLSGSGEYRELTGGGRGTGRISCVGRQPRVRLVHTGSVGTPPPPPPPIAPPGLYAGTTSQSDIVTFEALSDGHSIASLRFHQVRVRCDPDVPPTVAFLSASFPGRYPVDQDGIFAIAESDYTVTGVFTGTSARGTLSYESSRTDPFGTLRTCRSGTLTWGATSPPPPPPAVTPGRYCGVTVQTRSVCFDVTPELRVARFETEVTLLCNVQTSLVLKFVYGGTIAIRSNASFSAGINSAFPLEGGGLAAGLSITGTFQAGVASGSFVLLEPQFPYEGTWYRCRLGRTTWSASRIG